MIYAHIIFEFANFVNMPTKFNNKEPEYNRLFLLCGNHFKMNQIIRKIVSTLDPVDELIHHLGGAEIGVGRKSKIDDGFDVDSIVHNISSIHSTNALHIDII